MALSAVPAQATVTTGSTNLPRMYHQASALNDGRVLLTGGYARPGTTPYASTEIHDPATGTFTTVAPLLQGRVQHAAVTLNDGRVMVVGGTIVTSPGLVGTNTAEIYDPASGQWSAAGTMNVARSRAMARVLPSGKVFVISTDNYSNTQYAEVYDPQTGIFTKTGNMVDVSAWHGIVVLNDGRVLKIGGYLSSGYSNRAEIWNPATNQWSATGSMRETRQDISPVVLPDGRVLVAGGRNIMGLKTTEIYDPQTGLFSAGSDMPEAIEPHASVFLLNGGIVFTGEYTRNLMHLQTSTGQWNVSGPRRTAVRGASVTRLPNGNLLLAGGAALNDATNDAAVWDQACASQKIVVTDAAATHTVAGDGGLSSFNVTAAPGCRFELSNLPAWLALNSNPVVQMPAAGSVAVSVVAAPNASGAARAASFLLGNTTVTVTQPLSTLCPTTPSLLPTSVSFSAAAHTASVDVFAPATCPWRVSALPSWAALTSSSSSGATGNGRFTISVPANTGAARSGTGQLEFEGLTQSFTVSQSEVPICPSAPSFTPASLALPAAASSGTVTVSAPASCPWTISVPSWVTITAGASGTGNGSFAYSVAANSGAARNGTGAAQGPGVASTFLIQQDASPCVTWSINPRSLSLPATGGSGSLFVSAPSGCNWSLTAVPAWMTLVTAPSGSGNGSIMYSVGINSGAVRSAAPILSGSGPALALSVSQATTAVGPCSSAISSGVPVTGFLRSNGCNAGARGSSYYTDRYTFSSAPGNRVTILLTATSFDTYVYLRNPSGSVIYSNDDGGGGTNSRIPAGSGSYTLPTGSSGVYTIEVTSYRTYGTGAYTLSFTQ